MIVLGEYCDNIREEMIFLDGNSGTTRENPSAPFMQSNVRPCDYSRSDTTGNALYLEKGNISSHETL